MAVALSRDVPGNIIEFGVAEGDSTRILRRASSPKKRLFACDSFKGLPERFENAEVGTFACTPPNIRGVDIVEGFFDASLTPELAARVGRVCLASLDADLYSSTLCALRWLTPLLGSGSILVFDEFVGEQQSEKRAFEDWSRETGIETIKLAEFMRDPSAWGETTDRRVIFQVIGEEALPAPSLTTWGRFKKSPSGMFLLRIRNRLRGKA
jgi:hypothetical protein